MPFLKDDLSFKMRNFTVWFRLFIGFYYDSAYSNNTLFTFISISISALAGQFGLG
jgi:hypothetical protein